MNKPQSRRPMDVYFVMLVVATIFMFLACALMFVEIVNYGSPWADSGITR